jgi:hypothetical protein
VPNKTTALIHGTRVPGGGAVHSIKFGLKHCSKSLKQLIGTGSNDGGEVELSRDPTAATMGNQPIWPEVAAGMLASL